MESFSNKDGKVIVDGLIKVIAENKEYLSEIDGAIGDGDHGINMNKGFSITKERIEGKDIDMTEALKTLAMVLMTEIGGSMGPLYGTLFIEMAKQSKGKDVIDKDVFKEMLVSAIAEIQSLGNAQVGDKTLIDTLMPAKEAYEANLDKGFKVALKEMSVAAEKGKDSTVDLVAKIGRSARLGERSRGVLDAGATSCYLMLNSMADSMTALMA